MPYEKCVQKKLPECQYISGNSVHFGKFGGSHFSQVSTYRLNPRGGSHAIKDFSNLFRFQIAFFCGMSNECDLFENQKALHLAQRHCDQITHIWYQ